MSFDEPLNMDAPIGEMYQIRASVSVSIDFALQGNKRGDVIDSALWSVEKNDRLVKFLKKEGYEYTLGINAEKVKAPPGGIKLG